MFRPAFSAPFLHRFLNQSRSASRGCSINPAKPPLRASAVPKRTAALSILAGTSALSALAGGPSLIAWSTLFGVTGVITEVPVGFVCLAAGICAGLTDLIAFNIGYPPFDKSILPFLIFVTGGTVAGTLEAFGNEVDEYLEEEQKSEPGRGTRRRGDFAAWDGEFEKRDLHEHDG